jgi:hypothetical protein
MRKQFITLMLLTFTAVSAAAQAPTLTIVTETPGLPSELFYGSVKVKPVRLRPGTNTPITIDDADFFVQQHYLDFLRRFPDAPGHAFWTGEITQCSDPSKRFPGESEALCIDRKRVNDSGAFFLSPEFQNTGSFLVRVNWGSLGQKRAAGQKCIVGQHAALDAICQPLYSTYISEMTALTQGIVVNNALDHNRINQNKQAFVTAFVQRAEFLAEYPNTMTGAEYVLRLEQTTGVALTQPERDALAAEAGGSGGRASVLFKMVDGTTTIEGGALVFNTRYGQAYYNAQFNPVFVYMQYLGYLRRNPDQEGFDFWLDKLIRFGNFTDAEMVRSFIVSPEYRDRF